MSDMLDSFDLAELAESYDLECKAAQGREGKGELPEDFWKTYSAMANSEGGIILLGIQEKPRGQFRAIGLADAERVRKALWDNLHNRKQININLLSDNDIVPIAVQGRTVLRVRVPRATRQQRPVHIGSNPLTGTYLRRHEGDYLAPEEAVRRLLAEQIETSRDDRVLKGFGFDDLDMKTVADYRHRFAAVKPGHVWSDLALPDFLECIGAFGKNREENYSGLRLAGLLMFGRAEVIRDELPNYMVDFQERPEAKAEKRWVDRLVPDGTWSGNVYDFFRKVYQKLTVDLKVPFQLKDGQRVEDTPVHEALREALVNTLIHADYSGRVSLLVVKRPDMFGFRNPGLMRISPELAVNGGNSDCRNRRLQTMFQLVGYGDHAGSGVPKIYCNWAGQHWRSPALYESQELEQTLMELHMSSLVPQDVLADLQTDVGERFMALPELARLALITAKIEGKLNHARLRQISTDHSTDITKMLSSLVREGLLVTQGIGRGMVYFLPRQIPTDAFSFSVEGNKPCINTNCLTPELEGLTPELEGLTPELEGLTPELLMKHEEQQGELAVISDISEIPPEELALLQRLAAPVADRQRATPESVQEVVLQLCHGRFLSLRALAQLLKRNPNGVDLRKRILNPLVANQRLCRAYPDPNHPRQAYSANLQTTTRMLNK